MEAETTNVMEIIALIIDLLGMIAAFAAVFAAIDANRKASKALRYSLKMQEQTKNVELFDKRIALINEIKESDETSVLHLQLLFNDSIAKEYGAFRVCLNALKSAQHDMDIYEENMSAIDGEGMYSSPFAELQDAERILDELDYLNDKVEEFKVLCSKYQITYSDTNELHKAKVYNYENLSKQIASTRMKAVEQKNKVMDMMKKYIERSILPVGKKVRATK